ncbi:CCA tRNA nucleotidyltransferase [Paenisporosarcina quisquiliarum]|uniref:CCA tRNA nucleotidyltransferase n=1 Tax=Paenisporosarcina quisquiliarum TaxID=365346 RepID=UPI003736ED64
MSKTNEWAASQKIIETLQQQGFEAYVVGGAVRDIVLGKPATDIDIATSALPEEIKSTFPRSIDVGIAHGTIVVLMDECAIEVTTFRTDGKYVDHRRPTHVTFVRSLEEDMKRRDFTMNAMAQTRDEEIIDLFGGKVDIQNGIIRTVGDPNHRFAEDALRMLRAIRFSAQLNFQLEEKTSEAITNNAISIQNISVERITNELEKIWLSAFPINALKEIEKTKIGQWLPGSLNWSPEMWEQFDDNKATVHGWAFLSLLQNKDKQEKIPRLYRLSNLQKIEIQQIVKAVHIRKQRFFSTVDLYQFSEQTLVTAEKFVKILFPTIETTDSTTIVENKKALPIQSIKELSITGNDLMNWLDKPGGPWLKEMINEIVQAILHKEINNHPEQIKEWIKNESRHKN